MASVRMVEVVIGLEVHVELATRTKMFSRAPSPARRGSEDAEPNSLIDPMVLGLPGAMPAPNLVAVEMAMQVGMALGCAVAHETRWDRKNYFYPDMPKGYQVSQYDLPLCFDGAVDVPAANDRGEIEAAEDTAPAPHRRIGIIRAHLEEDAGKLLHEAPGGGGGGGGGRGGGGTLDGSIVDLNRAGTPLLEIVTAPDFRAAAEAVWFAQMLRRLVRFLGVSDGVMQLGQMRFEPNINTILTFDDGHVVKTPITEVKNLNSFKSLRGAIEHESREQPVRWARDRRESGPGQKRTMGWDDERMVTVPQRDKEDAHDYRYFPEPDLLPLRVGSAWRDAVRSRLPELPSARMARYKNEYALSAQEAEAIVEERAVCEFYEACIVESSRLGVPPDRSGRASANMVLQQGAKRANERGVLVSELGITPAQVAGIILLREEGRIGSGAADELFGLLCVVGSETAGADPAAVAEQRGLLMVRDEASLASWVAEAMTAQPQAVADLKSGKTQAMGRLVGEVMKRSGGKADAKAAREMIEKRLRE